MTVSSCRLRFGWGEVCGRRRCEVGLAEMEGATGEYVSGEPEVNGEEVEWATAGKL